MNKETEQIIIDEYLKGKGSTQIVKIVGLSKPTILKVLNNHNLIRKRDRCNTLDIKKDNDKFYLMWECNRCHNQIKREATNKTILCRNHFKLQQKNPVCRKCSIELQVGEGNPFYGKKHSNETKSHLSKIRKGTNVGDKNPMKKKENVDKLREIMKKKWENGEMEHARKIMSDKLKETRRLGKIKSDITSKKEKEIIVFLQDMGYEVINSFRVDSKTCDVFIPSLNLIIEYFGDYWRCNPEKYDKDYLNQKKGLYAKEIWEYDREKLDLIKSYGYNLEVIWEKDLKSNNNKLLTIIKNYDTNNKFTP